MDYLIAQLLSLVFYGITLATYNRARKTYVGGRIGAALGLIMASMVIFAAADAADYFLPLLLPPHSDTPLAAKIVLKLTAMGVLFFGGLRLVMAPTPAQAPAPTPAPSTTPPPQEPPEAAAAPVSPASQEQPPTLGRYQILEQVGRGAKGIVYRGIDPKLKRHVAIKTVRFTDDYDPALAEKVRRQFNQEAEVLAGLSHPNIVAVHDAGEDMDLTYLAMEYLEGESLERHTRLEDLLPLRRCVRIVQQICEALDYLHRHEIVHRDIKPSNIMLLAGDRVKLADFGIARAAAGTRTATGVIKGTPYYMSPEQAEGRKVTGASDLFSLGVVFYQLLTGRLPFRGENLSAILYQISHGEADPLHRHRPDLPGDLVAVVERALQKAPEQRQASAQQMADALQACLDSLPNEASAAAAEGLRPAVTGKTAPVASPPEKHPAVIRPETADGRLAVWMARLRPLLRRYRLALILSLAAVAAFAGVAIWMEPAPPTAVTSPLPPAPAAPVARQTVPAAPRPAPTPAPPPSSAALAPDASPSDKGPSPKPTATAPRPAADPGEPAALEMPSDATTSKTESPPAPPAGKAPAPTPKTSTDRPPPPKPAAKVRAATTAARQQQEALAREAQAAREAKAARRTREALAQREREKIVARIAAAETHLRAGEYARSLDAFEAARAMIDASDFQTRPDFAGYRARIERYLARDELVYGAKGYVRYRNRWLPPEEAVQARLDDGQVWYRRRFVPYTQLRPQVERTVRPKLQALVNQHYQGQLIHKQQIELETLSLVANTRRAARFEASVRWEVWTFDAVDRRRCTVEVIYDGDGDRWQTAGDCVPRPVQ